MKKAESFTLSRFVTRSAYGASQMPRIAWYLESQSCCTSTLRGCPTQRRLNRRRHVHTNAPVPDRSRIYWDMANLFLQDLANVSRGKLKCGRFFLYRTDFPSHVVGTRSQQHPVTDCAAGKVCDHIVAKGLHTLR